MKREIPPAEIRLRLVADIVPRGGSLASGGGRATGGDRERHDPEQSSAHGQLPGMSGRGAALENRPESITIRVVPGGLQTDGQATTAGGDAVDAEQAATGRDSEQLRIGDGRIDDFHECIGTRGVDAL